MNKHMGDISFAALLPSSISGDAAVAAAAQALDKELDSLNEIMAGLFLYSCLAELPEPLLKHLAWQWHVDLWDDGLSLEQKATLVAMSHRWHQLKGTPGAVEMILEEVLGGGRVEEWWEYGGKTFHFRVLSHDPPEDEAALSILLSGIEAARNARSTLDAIIKPASLAGGLSLGGAVSAGCNITLYQES